MSTRVILFTSLALLAFGVLCFTIFQELFSVVSEDGVATNPYWIVPIGYFSMLVGAFGLCWAWFRRKKVS